MKASYSSSESGSVASSFNRGSRRRSGGCGRARRLLLAQDVGDVIGAESAGGGAFCDGAGHCVRAVLADQFKQFA